MTDESAIATAAGRGAGVTFSGSTADSSVNPYGSVVGFGVGDAVAERGDGVAQFGQLGDLLLDVRPDELSGRLEITPFYAGDLVTGDHQFRHIVDDLAEAKADLRQDAERRGLV